MPCIKEPVCRYSVHAVTRHEGQAISNLELAVKNSVYLGAVAAEDNEWDQLRQHLRFIELTHQGTYTVTTGN